MGPIGTFALCIMMGFATSQILASLIGFATGQKGLAEFRPRSDSQRILALAAITFTGPAVLFENALTAHRKGEQPEGYLYIAVGIALSWSFLLGLLIVRLVKFAGLFG